MKKTLSVILTTAFVLVCMMVPAMAAAPEASPVADGIILEEATSTQYTVVSVGVVAKTDSPEMMDGASGFRHESREAVLTDKNGNKRTVTLGKNVKNFDQIKPGDLVTVTTGLQTAIFVGKIGEVPGAGQAKLIFSAHKGDKPGMIELEKNYVTLVINKLDPDKKTVSVTLPDNSKKTISTPNLNFAELKVGQDVIIEIKQETSVIVSAPAK